MTIALALFSLSVAVVAYAYVVYPALLVVLVRFRRRQRPRTGRALPEVSIAVPAYNEEANMRETLESLLALDYPVERRQILVISDASTDRTDEIVKEFAERGVELLRVPRRRGKTGAENAAWSRLRGDIIVNTDASARVHRDALKRLVARFADPFVGVVSGRDVSVGPGAADHNVGEAGYVGYEMWVRGLETQLGGIVGASGCLYAARRKLHMEPVAAPLPRDFAVPLIARMRGYRSVSADDALCYVRRTPTLQREFRRKVRTMASGLETLRRLRGLLNPWRYGGFAWMLASHKLCRWLAPWAILVGALSLVGAAIDEPWARWMLGVSGLAAVAAWLGWRWPWSRPAPRVCTVPAYLIMAVVAGLSAWVSVLRREPWLTWEPTRRGVANG